MFLRVAALLLFAFQGTQAVTEADLTKLVGTMQSKIHSLTRQLMLQQFFIEEKVRGDGDSGIKRIRLYNLGTRPYYAYSHTGGSILAIHDHADHDRIVGMGEFSAVLNGVEFRTRHNDYKLYMPHKTKKDYNAREPIPFPDVPPAVAAKKSIQEQIVEMREWFKAWSTQDIKHRDYRKYFPAVMCYLEGAWTTNTKSLEEPFESERHFIDAQSWFDLQNKVRFTAYNGRKSLQENYAYLPTSIVDMTKDNEPMFAQWNYRIMCNPIKGDLPFDRLRPAEELQLRMANKYTMEKYQASRRARFTLSPVDGKFPDKETHYRTGLLDKIMAQIPGKDNYPANLKDSAFDLIANDINTNKVLNTGYYHRWYKSTKKGQTGGQVRHRGYSDGTVFMAQTSHPKVASMKLEDCSQVSGKRVCKSYSQRWTYAVPMEIIYLTPLMQWNPYNLKIKEWNDKSIEANGRNGGFTKEKAYNGVRGNNKWYLTPSQFYSGAEVNVDAADTSRGPIGVLDQKGQVRSVRASGVRVFMPNIPGVGVLRQRFPVPAIHAEGSAAYKEISALTDMVMEQNKYKHLYRTPPIGTSSAQGNQIRTYELEMSISTRDPPGRHTHRVILSEAEHQKIVSGQTVTKDTSTGNSHSHKIAIKYNKNLTKSKYYFTSCDGKTTCWDGHDKYLTLKN